MMKDNFLARTIRETRLMKEKSQEYMAMELGITRKTVQNWEKGVSEPTIEQAMQWFRILQVSPLPYLFQYVFPDMENISSGDEDDRLRDALLKLAAELPSEGMRQLLYLFYGDHGSSPRVVLNLITAFLQSPHHDRIVAGNLILLNYEMARQKEELTSPHHIQPNVELLKGSDPILCYLLSDKDFEP